MLDEFGGDTRGEMAVIGLYPGHDASIARAVGGRVQCVLELERLFDVRYFCPTYSDVTRFRDEWTPDYLLPWSVFSGGPPPEQTS